MFTQARIKLTVFYLAIILFISGIFSVAFYNASTREIDRIMRRLEFDKYQHDELILPRPPRPDSPSIEELLIFKERIQITLVIVNGLILILAGAAGYFLAGKTLYPIQKMIGQQNQFISDASHELRTPIATLQAEMEAKLLDKKISDKSARHLIKSNLEELTTLKTLTDNLLKLTRIHYLNDNQHTEKVSIIEIVNTAKNRVISLANKKQIALNIKIPEAIIFGNKNRLIEAFIILFENAIKYSPPDTKIIAKGERSASTITVSVTDQGTGIAKQDLPHIFERFYRADKSRSVTEGFGLGLSIVKNIIDSHHGSITAASRINKGSVFVIKLPLIS